jgi:hypothetical protein
MALTPAIEAAKNHFAAKHGLNATDPRTLEAFFTHHILLQRNLSDFTAARSWHQEKMILVGGSGDTQLDAIVILVNNEDLLRPGDSLDELEQALANDEPVQISFIFVQATGAVPGNEVLTHKMSAFSDGVYAFLDPGSSSTTGVSKSVAGWIELKNSIFSILQDANVRACCDCSMYFVSPRNISSDANIDRTIATARNKIINHKDLAPLFHSVDFINVGRDRIERWIEDAGARKGDLTISADRFIQAPASDTAATCYVGYLTAREVLGLISEDGNGGGSALNQNIFAKNIRGFVGAAAAVNGAIAATLRDPEQRRQFGFRSNGLAIIARSQEKLASGRILFTGAQIVNGCQTSHVIYAARPELHGQAGEEVWLPAKIIVTADKATEDAAILGLNRQTPVHEAQVFAEKDFVDRLAWEFANSPLASTAKAIFEKREGEFKERDDIEPNQILTLYDIAQAYAAAFLDKPEALAGGGKQPIIEKIRDGAIFGKHESPAPYCLSGVMLYHAREAVKRHHPKRWKQYPMKNMLLFAMRLCAERHAQAARPDDRSDEQAVKLYFDKLGKVFSDDKTAGKIADGGCQIIGASLAASHMKMENKSARSAALAAEIASRIAKAKSLCGDLA